MKLCDVTEYVKIPKGDARKVTVTGPRGTITKCFNHVSLSLKKVSKTKLAVTTYFGAKRQVQCVNTVRSLISNMITGVTKGFKYVMRLVYAHYPINIVISQEGRSLEVRNYLGQKLTRKVDIPENVKAYLTNVKDELIIEGNDVDEVSLTSAKIWQIARVHNRDIRKFLDGIYLLNKTTIVA